MWTSVVCRGYQTRVGKSIPAQTLLFRQRNWRKCSRHQTQSELQINAVIETSWGSMPGSPSVLSILGLSMLLRLALVSMCKWTNMERNRTFQQQSNCKGLKGLFVKCFKKWANPLLWASVFDWVDGPLRPHWSAWPFVMLCRCESPGPL